ncbi:MAG: histidinol-phosphate transaminase [Planctomycetaceae bacterium]|nr:histidinol-phosphate transaminase [Planctomycetaceae bacterium]
MTFFRNNIDAMTGYEPGEQPAAGVKVIKLNTNENPYPPSPAVVRAVHAFDPELLRRYPDPMARAACRAAAEALGVPADCVLAGNGSDDLLTIVFRACLGEGRIVTYPTPTYVLYQTLAKIQNAPFVEVPYPEDYALPFDALRGVRAAVTIVANPNSPSGTLVPLEQMEKLAAAVAGVLVIDEAYADFAEGNALSLVAKFPNVVVLRTLSKGYSLAGLRMGFAFAQPTLLDGLNKVKDSYNVDAIACAAAAAAMKDQPWKNANAEKVKASRAKLSADLAAMGFKVWPSQSNFVLARPPRGNASEIYQALKAAGILVRYFNQPRLDDKLRISIGTEEQNAELIGAIKKILDPRS